MNAERSRLDSSRSAWPRVSWIAALLLLTVGYRIGAADSESLANTAPLMAACFGGGLLLGWRFCWVPALLLLVGDLFLGLSHGTGVGVYTLTSGLAYTGSACLGAAVGRRAKTNGGRWWMMLGGTLACSVLFYLLGNTWAWMASPGYAKTLAGWWQSQTVGLPGPYPPSLYFLRNALIGDSIWCLLASPLFFWNSIREASASGSSLAGSTAS